MSELELCKCTGSTESVLPRRAAVGSGRGGQVWREGQQQQQPQPHLRCRRWAVSAAPLGTRCGAGCSGVGTAWWCPSERSWQPGMGTPGSSRGCCRLKCWDWTPEPSPTWRSSGRASRAAGEKTRNKETAPLASTVFAKTHQKNSLTALCWFLLKLILLVFKLY